MKVPDVLRISTDVPLRKLAVKWCEQEGSFWENNKDLPPGLFTRRTTIKFDPRRLLPILDVSHIRGMLSLLFCLFEGPADALMDAGGRSGVKLQRSPPHKHEISSKCFANATWRKASWNSRNSISAT